MCRDIDAVEQRARFRRIEHRCLSRRHDVPGPAHRARRIDRHDLAGDEPVEQMTDCGETTLGVASSRVPASIQVATCTGCTAPIDGTRRWRTRSEIHPRTGHRPAACAGCGC